MRRSVLSMRSRGLLLGLTGGGMLLLSGCAETMVSQGQGQPLAPAPAGQAATPAATPPAAPPVAVYPPYDGVKKRLAVLKFENKVKTPIPNPSWNIGDGLTEMLSTELFKTGRFIMVERAALAEIVKEQELGQSGLVQRETAAKVGDLLGAQLLVAGAVTEFEATSSGGGGGVGFRGLSLAIQMSNAHVGVDVRLVDSTTGQILKSYNASATAQSTGLGFGATVQGVRFGSDGFQKTPLGEATREAIQKAVRFVIGQMELVPWTGRVVQVSGTEVYVNAGASVNLKPGMTLAAYAKGEELTDPATGLKLGSRDRRIGAVTLTQIEDKFSIGTFAGEGLLKRGDLLKLQ